jgi:signal transduction histidine kinase
MIDESIKAANILIVDDQEANIDVLTGLLKKQGYTNIMTTIDPRDVIPLFESFKPDILLLDLAMPFLSGFEVMELLKEHIAQNTFFPILVLTADVTIEAKKRALSGGANDFLTKPFDLIEVGLRIQNLLYTSFLQKQLQNQNQILEQRVKERTSELEMQNIELIAAKEKAEASDRLKSSFISNISHEIRTPLNGILGFGQILSDVEIEAEERELYIKMLKSSSSRLINTITNFLDISLLTSGNQKVFRKEINASKLIQEVVKKYEDDCISKNNKLSVQAPTDDIEIKLVTDGEMVGKILNQLVDNAIKFTQQGNIQLGYQIIKDQIHFFVRDTGIGISAESQKLIFDNFVQEDNTVTRGYEGSGLGLSIAKKFVEFLDGQIWLESEKGKGSVFYFSLPCEKIAAPDSIQEIVPEQSTGSQQTLLIAEDNDINFKYYNLILKNEFIKILHAWNGVEAVDLSKHHPEIKLVMMDLKMPEMNGFEATRQIKAFRNDLPIIVVTAHSGSEDHQKAIDAGCDDVMIKPIKRELLISKLKEFGLLFK